MECFHALALEATLSRTRLHGLQVGLATYCIARLQGSPHLEGIANLFAQTHFWGAIRDDPFPKNAFLAAVDLARSIKPDFHTILSQTDAASKIVGYIDSDPILAGCFID